MATSGSTNFSISRDNIISRAQRLCGVITTTATLTTEAAIALNSLVKALAADGMPLFGITTYSLTPVLSTRTYRIGLLQTIDIAKPLKIISAYSRYNSLTDTPMSLLTRDEYDRLGNKFSTGIPIQLYYHPQVTYGDLYLFPVPNAVAVSYYSINIVYQRIFEDFDASADTPDFPQEAYDMLSFMLADRLSLEYGVAKETRDDIRVKAIQYHSEFLSFGTEEGSFYFQKDVRNY